MKFKYYIRGLGTGLIITTCILMISRLMGTTASTIDNSQETSSVPSIIAIKDGTDDSTESETYDSTSQSDSGETDGTSDTSDATTDAVTSSTSDMTTTTEATSQATTDITETVTKETTTAAQATSQATSAIAETLTSVSTSAAAEVTVVFSGVTTAYKAADILINAGLISDKNEFVLYMYNNGYDSKMQDGTYTIAQGATIETIAKTITRSK